MTAYLITSLSLGVLSVLINLGKLVSRNFTTHTAGIVATTVVINLIFMAWAGYLLVTN